MNLYERSAGLRVALDTASKASGDHELVERGQRVIDLLNASVTTLSDLRDLSRVLQFGPANLEAKTLSQSARQLRTGFARYQAEALQHASTTNFEKAVRDIVKLATRWAEARWRELFDRWVDPIDRAIDATLVGDAERRHQAKRKAQKMKALSTCNPVTERDQIDEFLAGVEMAAWCAAIETMGGELTSVLQQLEESHRALGLAVREALDRAATIEGLPLDEVSPELLVQLRDAGVLDSLVVRRS